MCTQEEFEMKVEEWLNEEGNPLLGSWVIGKVVDETRHTVKIRVSQTVIITIEKKQWSKEIQYSISTKDDEDSIHSAVIALYSRLEERINHWLDSFSCE